MMILRFLFASVLGLGITSSLIWADEAAVVPSGSILAGKTLFVDKGCFQCHAAGEIKMPTSDLSQNLILKLGGESHSAWTRDDFARSIMNPNHTVSEEYRIIMITLGDKFKAENSPMPGFKDILTVSDLIHLTTFLDSLK
tara:strand:+ start:2503 stop:2922 length:420 start_codon:yes stop_codon:yes gene_type:complete